MKSLIFLCILVVSSGALAESKRSLYDIMYLPQAGTSFGFSEGTLVNGKYMKKNEGKTDYDGYKFSQTVGHAFSNSFLFSLAMDYSFLQTQRSGFPTIERTGHSDPTLFARYRLEDEQTLFDLFMEAKVSVGDREIKSNLDQNALDGGHTLRVGAQFGRKYEESQWAFIVRYSRIMEATTELAGTKFDSDAHNGYLVKLEGLANMSKESILRGFVSADLVEGFDSDLGRSASSTTYTFGGEYQYLVSANFLWRVGLQIEEINQDNSNQYDFYNVVVGANYQF